jgi:hypothetical protein
MRGGPEGAEASGQILVPLGGDSEELLRAVIAVVVGFDEPVALESLEGEVHRPAFSGQTSPDLASNSWPSSSRYLGPSFKSASEEERTLIEAPARIAYAVWYQIRDCLDKDDVDDRVRCSSPDSPRDPVRVGSAGGNGTESPHQHVPPEVGPKPPGRKSGRLMSVDPYGPELT